MKEIVTLEIIKTHKAQDSIWYVTARKLCLVVDNPVKIWSRTLSSKNCHLTILCLSQHFGTILTIFAKSKYHFDFDNSAIRLQSSINEELCHFPFSLNNFACLSFFFVRTRIEVDGLLMLSVPNLICYILCRLRSIAAHRDNFVRRLSVRPCVCW